MRAHCNGIIYIGKVAPSTLSNAASYMIGFLKEGNNQIDGYVEPTVFHVNFAKFSQKPVSTYDVCIIAHYIYVPSWLTTAGKSGDELQMLWEVEFQKSFNELIERDRRYTEISPETFNHRPTYDESIIVTSRRFERISKVHACLYAEAIERASESVSKISSLYLVFPEIGTSE